ncbi:hypothetical protein N9R79_11220 [Vibrio sp.]|nr:hypothetical protein [Vibrio sp.]
MTPSRHYREGGNLIKRAPNPNTNKIPIFMGMTTLLVITAKAVIS